MVLLFAREKKPLYGMLECISYVLDGQVHFPVEVACKAGGLCQTLDKEEIEKIKDKIEDCVWWGGLMIGTIKWTLSSMNSSWMLTGILCQHVIVAIEIATEDVDSFIAKCYSTEAFEMLYAAVIYPV